MRLLSIGRGSFATALFGTWIGLLSWACSSGESSSATGAGGSNGGIGGASAGGSAGKGGNSGGIGGQGGGVQAGSGGSSQAGGAAHPECPSGGACDPAADPQCDFCEGPWSAYCYCFGLRWACVARPNVPCGSARCGLSGESCQESTTPSCEYCDDTGSRLSCSCGPSGQWECSASAGACGMPCGDRRCLDGEICVGVGQFGGTLDSGAPSPDYQCAKPPVECQGQEPSCACLQAPFGCTLPGVCRELGGRTFDCLRGGA
jgi:hypothetical protein